MGNEPVRFEGEVTWPEYRHIRRRLPPWWGRTTTVLVVALLALGKLGRDVGLFRIDDGQIVIQLVLAGVTLAILLGVSHLLERWQWKSYNRIHGKTTGEVSVGLRWKTDLVTSDISWTKVTGHKIDDQLVLIYYSTLCAYFLPRSFVSDESSWNALQATVKQHSKALG
jgi:hypothetical protein